MRPGEAARSKPRRGEIEGLRAVAIALVVLYHLWGDGRVSGGVDVFLMISAYLLTASMVRRGPNFRYFPYLVRRFAGLLPSASIVIVAILIGSYLVMPPARWPGLIHQGLTSLGYWQNWTLIDMATSYTNGNKVAASPYQHFWSLSIQGQIFLVWPLILALALGLRRFGVSLRKGLTLLFGAITLLSFGYAQFALVNNPTAAYFDTFARVWEFSLASMLALIPVSKIPRNLSAAASWLGLLGLVLGGFLIGRMNFPGVAALWPFACAAAVVVAPQRPASWQAGWLLNTPLLTWFGSRGYGIYLWHWPLLIFTLTLTHQSHVGPALGAAVIGVSVVLADLTRKLSAGITRLDRLSIRRGITAIATCTLVVALLAGGWTRLMSQEAAAARALAERGPSGAEVAQPAPGAPSTVTESLTGPIAPGDTVISQDWPQVPAECQGGTGRKLAGDQCHEYRPAGTPSKTVMVIGDSHAVQWSTLLLPMAMAENWHFTTMMRPSCRFTVDPDTASDCVDYNEKLTDFVLDSKPDIVVTIGTRAEPNAPDEVSPGVVRATKPLRDAGIRVVAIRDNPRWDFPVPECVQTYGRTSDHCAAARENKLAADSPLNTLSQIPGFKVMDLSDQMCPNDRCRPVIGGVYVYMDDNHLSRTYVASMRTPFAEQWARASAG